MNLKISKLKKVNGLLSFTILIPFPYIKDLFLTALTIRFPQEYLKVEPFWMFLTNTQKWSTITSLIIISL